MIQIFNKAPFIRVQYIIYTLNYQSSTRVSTIRSIVCCQLIMYVPLSILVFEACSRLNYKQNAAHI